MRRRRLRLLALAALAILWSPIPSAAQPASLEQQRLELLAERDRLSREVRILEAELSLSEQKRPYLVADFHSRELILKVHGLAVKRVAAAEVRKLGGPVCTTGVTTLDRFDAVEIPKIDPTSESGSETSVALSDMPRSYELGFLADGQSVSLQIHPAPTTALSRTWTRVSTAFASGGRTLLQALGYKQPVYLWLIQPEDAQALFWALEKGSQAILVCD